MRVGRTCSLMIPRYPSMLVHAMNGGDNLVHIAHKSQRLAPTILGDSMLRLLVTVLLLSSLSSAQATYSAASAAKPAPVSDLPAWSTTLTQPNRYISAHGTRGFAGGYSEDGLEFWSFPLQLVSGYHLSFVLPKAPSLSAITMLTSVEFDPFGVTR